MFFRCHPLMLQRLAVLCQAGLCMATASVFSILLLTTEAALANTQPEVNALSQHPAHALFLQAQAGVSAAGSVNESVNESVNVSVNVSANADNPAAAEIRISAQAFALFRQAAEQGHAGAQFVLADAYQRGLSVPQDFAQAMHWYQRSAQQNYALAQSRLGNAFSQGLGAKSDAKSDAKAGMSTGVKKDLAKAFYWHRRAALQGVAEAQFNLAQAYRLGKGCDIDLTKARQWFHRAALQGLAQAQYNLAMLQALALGGERDLPQALNWLEKAAAQGHADAAHNRQHLLLSAE